jgi:hypothetical protein
MNTINCFFCKLLTVIANSLFAIAPWSKTLLLFSDWCETHYQLTCDEKSLTQADYYNGSNNDLINIFIEIDNLSRDGHNYHGNYLLKRLTFLANEGLTIAESPSLRASYSKLTDEEANDIIAGSVVYKKSRKSSKPKPVRDKKGRFIKKKKK